jgi:Ca2+-transporting ATPase
MLALHESDAHHLAPRHDFKERYPHPGDSRSITVVQETRTERVLEALRDLTSPRALVIRGGQRLRIAGRDVVRGDIVVLSEGDRIPADAVLLRSQDLQADESLLTGESVPVRKIARVKYAAPSSQRPGGDDLPYVFSGSLVVRGTGLAEVTATGARSEIGRIGQSLGALETGAAAPASADPAPGRLFALIGVAVSFLAVLLYGFMRGGWLDAVLAGIALGAVDAAGRVACRTDRIHGDGCVANFACTGADAERRGDRNGGLGDRALYRQDGDAPPRTGCRLSSFGYQAETSIARTRWQKQECRTRSRFLPNSACSPRARAIRSHGEGFTPLARKRLTETNGQQHAGWILSHAYGLRPDLLAVTQRYQPDAARRNSWSPPSVRLKRSRTFAVSTRPIAPR